LINDSARDAVQAHRNRSMSFEERDVSGVGAIQGRLAVAGHHDI